MGIIRGMRSVRLFFRSISTSHLSYVERVVLSIVETDAWIKELMATVDNRKGRVESYIELLSKESKYLDSLFHITGY
jgi:hypothetical protein